MGAVVIELSPRQVARAGGDSRSPSSRGAEGSWRAMGQFRRYITAREGALRAHEAMHARATASQTRVARHAAESV